MRAAKYRRAAKCSGFGCCSRKTANLRRSAGESYTCDSSPGEDAAAGENVNAARLGCSAAPTAPWGNSDRGGRLKAGDECYMAGKGQQDQMVPVNYSRLW